MKKALGIFHQWGWKEIKGQNAYKDTVSKTILLFDDDEESLHIQYQDIFGDIHNVVMLSKYELFAIVKQCAEGGWFTKQETKDLKGLGAIEDDQPND